jgi:hyperosmotically inducible periplasmic protein
MITLWYKFNIKNHSKMKLRIIALASLVACTVAFTSCKPKDGDIKANIEKALLADPSTATTKVEVKDGVVTLSGECKDEACKANCEKLAKEVKGVKNVVNNCAVFVAPVIAPASVDVAANVVDPKLQDAVKAIIKDIPGIALKGFSAKGAILEGTLSAANNMKLKQAMMAAKIMLDGAASKITVK